ncbi:MAG: HD domain-containing protein [Thermoplasmata archaeon]
MRRKAIFDPIHGQITLSGAPLELISHPAFQRLWGIRQTGFAHLVFPGANHTRLEHSLGVYWVAQAMAAALGLSTTETELVTSGGLLHDLGHGPFSHTLEPTMREVLGYGHEKRGRQLILGEETRKSDEPPLPFSIPEMLESYHVDPHAVADLIDPPLRDGSRSLLRSMLHSAIDADRIDYLQRDAHYTGVAHGTIDAARIIETVRVDGDRLAFAEKGRSALEGFLVGRALMYSSVYYHKTVRSAEVMAQSAVERLPAFPDSARPLFGRTDGDLLAELRSSGDRAAEIAQALRERRLFKRLLAWTDLPAQATARWRRTARNPRERRATEDRLADRLRVARGSILLDLAGFALETRPHDDWRAVTVLDEEGAHHPFRGANPWNSIIRRPPTIIRVGVYVDPRCREITPSRLRRAFRAE